MSQQMKTLTVAVTAADIKRGIAGSAMQCAIALALERKLGKVVLVGYKTVDINPCGPEHRYLLSEAAQSFVRRFDKKIQPIKPATFRLTEM
jgi:hypothetical protein